MAQDVNPGLDVAFVADGGGFAAVVDGAVERRSRAMPKEKVPVRDMPAPMTWICFVGSGGREGC